mgnify:CR=1 FL=1
MRYSKTGETELIWRMSRYFSTPEPLTRTISPARDCEWVNEWEVNHTKKQIEEQPSRIAQLEKELEMFLASQTYPELQQQLICMLLAQLFVVQSVAHGLLFMHLVAE